MFLTVLDRLAGRCSAVGPAGTHGLLVLAVSGVMALAGCASAPTQAPVTASKPPPPGAAATAAIPAPATKPELRTASPAQVPEAGSPAARKPASGDTRSSAPETRPQAAEKAESAPSAADRPGPAAVIEAADDQPVVVVSRQVPAPEPDLWKRIRKGFALPALETALVAEKEKFYLQRPDYLERMFTRGNRYLYHIVEEVEKRGLPTELALLPFVESAMNPVALSSAQAAGLWQFIPSTGRDFNLSQNWWVDNRRDIVHSTRAALDYLQKIYAMHGNDWFLALASYNWGEGAVGRAVRKNQMRGLPTHYLNLEMPNETRHYIPKLMAIKNIIARAPELGVNLPASPNKAYFVTIEKTRPIDLKLAAQFANMSVDEFVALNPAHNRPVIAASKNNEIKLPADRLDAFVEAATRHERARKTFASWQPYTLQAGETLETIAQRGGVTVAEIQKANGLKVSGKILPGTQLLAPQNKPVADESRVESFVAPRVYELVTNPPVYHTVGRKDTVQSIAQRYGVSAASITALNGSSKLRRGATLLVRAASTHTMLTTETGNRQIVPASVAKASPSDNADDSVSSKSVKTPASDKSPVNVAAVPAVASGKKTAPVMVAGKAIKPAAKPAKATSTKARTKVVRVANARKPSRG